MTILKKRPNTALIVVDVQNGVVAGAYEHAYRAALAQRSVAGVARV